MSVFADVDDGAWRKVGKSLMKMSFVSLNLFYHLQKWFTHVNLLKLSALGFFLNELE